MVNGFKTNNMKLLCGVLVIISLSILCGYLVQGNLTYANKDVIFIFEDLKVGDFIPNGSTIMTTEDYHGGYGDRYNHSKEYTEGYINYAKIYYYEVGKSLSWCSAEYCYVDEILNFSSYKISDYEDVFSSENNYIGWVVKSIKNSIVYLEPVDDYSKINRTPALDNSYTIDTYFVDTEDNLVNNAWYLVNDIADYKIEGDNFWIKEDNVLRFRNTGDYPVGNSYTLTYTFEAAEGEFLTFDTRSWLGYYIPENRTQDSLIIKFNDKDLSLPTGRKCPKSEYTGVSYCYQNSGLFETVTLPIEKSGKQTLSFTYTVKDSLVQNADKGTYTYGYVRGVSLLSPLNEGKQLDTSLVKEGDKILYKSSDPDGYVLGEKIVYTNMVEEKPADTPEEQPPKEEILNPNTNAFVFGGFVILLIASLVTLVIIKKKKADF